MSAFGDPRLPTRFWEKVADRGNCWEWIAARDPLGYGRFWWKNQMRLAHRVAYVALVGEHASDLELDHLCRNPSCLRPDHLEPVSHALNLLRGNTFSAANAAKTHCKRGHPLNGPNLIVRIKPDGRRYRACRTCCQASWRRSDARKRSLKQSNQGATQQ
jgi:hypothetical protein